jgi:uncharacterized membrane protein
MSLKLFSSLFGGLFLVTLILPLSAIAQTIHQDVQERVPAEVLEITDETVREIIGTGANTMVQEVRVQLKGGERNGEVVTMINEVVPLKPGDKIFVNRVVTIGGEEYITYADFERRPVLLATFILFVVMLLFFSRWQGFRALVSLGLSILAIFYILVPALLAGYDPALTTILVAAIIMAVVLFGTHGFKARSMIAFLGTMAAIVITGILAFVSTYYMRMTGFSNEASVYLNFATKGQLDLAGLLLGSIVIGILGILDDVAVTQVSVVQELRRANAGLKFKELYNRSIRVGQDHLGSLVNTLALAYAGIALPLMLLYAQSESAWTISVNQEVISVELIRIFVGSIGLILAVPITTAIAAWYFEHRLIIGEAEHDHHHHHHHH